MPNLATYLDGTPACKWYVVWYGSKNACQKDMYFQDINLHAQNMITILSSIVNLINDGGGVHDHLIKHDNIHFDYE